MSSFICEKCGKSIIDAPGGYVTECSHYPFVNVKKKDVELEKIKKLLNIKYEKR